jgi:predicted aspartyl protease
MIKGKIENGLHPQIGVEVAGKISSPKFLALVDTGFDSDIALHRQEAAKLGLKIKNYIWIDYADGERVKEPICPARVLWHGKWKAIKVVLSNDEEPAVGTHLLQGSVATLDFVKNRLAIEEPIRAKRRKR